jgi:hypothetical protein
MTGADGLVLILGWFLGLPSSVPGHFNSKLQSHRLLFYWPEYSFEKLIAYIQTSDEKSYSA